MTTDIQLLGGSRDGCVIKASDRPSAVIDFPMRVRWSLDSPGQDFIADRYELKYAPDGRAFYVHPSYRGGPPAHEKARRA
jgi:hypothetical protein